MNFVHDWISELFHRYPFTIFMLQISSTVTLIVIPARWRRRGRRIEPWEKNDGKSNEIRGCKIGIRKSTVRTSYDGEDEVPRHRFFDVSPSCFTRGGALLEAPATSAPRRFLNLSRERSSNDHILGLTGFEQDSPNHSRAGNIQLRSGYKINSYYHSPAPFFSPKNSVLCGVKSGLMSTWQWTSSPSIKFQSPLGGGWVCETMRASVRDSQLVSKAVFRDSKKKSTTVHLNEG